MSSPTVVIMDDNPDVRCVLREALHEMGYAPLTTPDGYAGLELALREEPELLIVDMMMPGQSGFQVVKKFREVRGHGVPVLMISANGDPRHQAYAAALGVDSFLTKPFRLTELTEEVRRLRSEGAGEPVATVGGEGGPDRSPAGRKSPKSR